MKLTIRRVEFVRMLNFASQAIPARNADVQYLNFLLDITEEGLSVIASNGSLSTKVFQPLRDEKGNEIIYNVEPGMIQTQAKLLLDAVSKMGGEVISLTMVDTNYINLSDDSTNYNLITKAGEEYPNVNLSVPSDKEGFEVSLADLKKLFSTTSYATATKGPKELYYGVNVKAEGGKLSFMATDSYRMAKLSLPEKNQDALFSFTCPTKAMEMVTRIDTLEKVMIYFDEQSALFVAGNIAVSTRLLRGDFPSIDRLIPPSFPFSFTVKKESFLQAADRVMVISTPEDRNSPVRLTISKDGGVSLSSKNANLGDAIQTLKDATFVLPEDTSVFEIGFNVTFAMDAVKAMESDDVTFVFSSPTRMFMIKDNNPDNIHIITPIRMSSLG